MKFIGQYIQDFIARFRSDVYLEDVSSGTIASGGNLGLDSNNKIVKANEPTSHDAVTLAGTPDYITISGQEITRNAVDLAQDVTGTLAVSKGGTGVTSLGSIDISSLNNDSGFTSNTGDITSVGISEGSNVRTVSSGSATISFVDGEGIDLASAALGANTVQLTISGEDASTSNKGVASFSSDNFAASSGEITIKSGGVDLTDEVTGTLPVGNGGTGATTLASNSILTGNGTSAVQAESGLTYDSEVLNVGDDDDGTAEIRRLRHTDDNGGQLYIRGGDATGTDKDGGVLRLYGGRGTGSGSGGAVSIATSKSGSSGTTFHTSDIVATFRADGDTILNGNLIFEGPTPDTNETTFSITDPTADRTITVPDADVDLTKVRAATTSLDGVVELATTAETTTGTDTTRAVTPDGLKDGYQGSTNVTTLGSITTGEWRGTAIDQAYLSGQSGTNTGDEPDASTSVKGIVELATTGEADTGTDTSRAVTPAGLKSHVDARFAYQYISFVGNITANTSGNGYWEYPSPNGISNHTWNQIVKNTTGGVNNRDTTTVGDEVGIDRLNQGSAGIRIPYAGTIVGFTGSGRNASGDRAYYAGLFVGTPDWGTTNDINAELVAVAQADNTPGGTYTSRASKLEDLSRSYSIAAGDVIYPAIKGSGTNADIIQANMTIVIKTSLV